MAKSSCVKVIQPISPGCRNSCPGREEATDDGESHIGQCGMDPVLLDQLNCLKTEG